MTRFKRLVFVFSCATVMSACGGNPTAASTTNGGSSSTGSQDNGLAGTSSQPFAQRVSQTSYPTASLLESPEAMRRILGSDLDNNGIRDDVDEKITQFTKKIFEIKAYQQYAKVLQKRYTVETKAEAYSNTADLVRAVKCLRRTFEMAYGPATKNLAAYDQVVSKTRVLSQMTVDTIERVWRVNEVASLKQGASFSFDPTEDLSNTCD